MGRERERFNKAEQWQRIYRRDRGTCQHCGSDAQRYGTPQLAHVIADTKTMRKLYGRQVLEHDLNKRLTCSLACNALVQVTNSPIEREALVAEIQEAINEEA
jgi:hypothetical protein